MQAMVMIPPIWVTETFIEQTRTNVSAMVYTNLKKSWQCATVDNCSYSLQLSSQSANVMIVCNRHDSLELYE